MALCPRCGRDNPENCRFCRDCHFFLGSGHDPEEEKAPAPRDIIIPDDGPGPETVYRISAGSAGEGVAARRDYTVLIWSAVAVAALILVLLLSLRGRDMEQPRQQVPTAGETTVPALPSAPAAPSTPGHIGNPPAPAAGTGIWNPEYRYESRPTVKEPQRSVTTAPARTVPPAGSGLPAATAPAEETPARAPARPSSSPAPVRPGGVAPPSAPPGYAPEVETPENLSETMAVPGVFIELNKPLAAQTPRVLPHD